MVNRPFYELWDLKDQLSHLIQMLFKATLLITLPITIF